MTKDQVTYFFEMHYDTKLEYLWDKSPNYAVFQHKKNKEWSGLHYIKVSPRIPKVWTQTPK